MGAMILGMLLACGAADTAEFKAGIGRAVITPQGPAWMSGYASRNHPSEGVIHDLWAKALALEDAQGDRVVIVTTDLIGLPREVADDVAARVGKRHGLERSQVLLNSSHTHSGPAVWPSIRVMFDFNAEDQQRAVDYARKLADTLVEVIDAAMKDLRPAQVSCGHGSADFAVNRREPTPKGVRIGVNAKGPVDHDVPVLKVAGPDGRLRAVLFGYGCHNTTLGGDFYQINGDYAGFAEIELEKTQPGATAMFLMLCGGDQNPSPRGTVELAQQHGKSLATEVGRVLSGELRAVRSPLRSAFERVDLAFAPQERKTFEEEAKSPNRFKQRRAQLMLKAYDEGRPAPVVQLPIQAVRLGGELTLLAIGGEVVVDYSLRLKREFPEQNVVVAGYSNDVPCYIPSRRLLSEGGYETNDSMIYYGCPGPLADTVEATIVETCRRLLKRTEAQKTTDAGPAGAGSRP